MRRIICGIAFFCVIMTGCGRAYDAGSIAKIVDFELSPDEDKIAFSAVTPVGNTDIWVVNIDGSGLKKLTFKDHSPTNNVARFFKKRKWRNFYEIDMRFPKWTKDGRIAFCEEITKHHITGISTAGLIQWSIACDGSEKRKRTAKDEILKTKQFGPINKPIMAVQSEKHKKKIFLKDGLLWVLNYNEATPKKLI